MRAGTGNGRRGAHGALDLGNHFRRMARCAHPVQLGDVAAAVNGYFQHANGVQHGRQLALENPLGVQVVHVGCRV
jgi:hypothetical protein